MASLKKNLQIIHDSITKNVAIVSAQAKPGLFTDLGNPSNFHFDDRFCSLRLGFSLSQREPPPYPHGEPGLS